jgi:membrane-associated phospholipid phosphatase
MGRKELLVNVKRLIPALVAVATLGTPGLWAQTADDLPRSSEAVTQELSLAPAADGKLLGSLPPLELDGDGRRTMGRFVPNLGRNLVGVLSPRNAGALGLGASLAGASLLADRPVQRYFSTRPRAEEFGELGQQVGGAKLMAPVTLGLLLAGRISHDSRFRAATYDMGQAMIVSQVYTTGLKLSVGRTRPDGSNQLSFPSGHTASAFSIAAVADHYYGHRAGIAAYAAAGLIGISRMERNKHHVSDVLAGATLGWISARTVIHGNGDPLRRKEFSLAPVAPPSGAGVGVGVSFAF